MSRCSQTAPIVDSLFSGLDLTASQESHAGSCADCARATSLARRFERELGSVSRELSPDMMPAFAQADWGTRISIARPARGRQLWLGLAAAIAAAVAIVVILPAGNSALGSWTSIPTSSERIALADATVDACRDRAATVISVGEAAGWREDESLRSVDRLPLVAHDQRGDASAALFADEEDHAAWICAIVPVEGQPSYVELNGGGGLVPEDFGAVEVWTASAGWNWDYGGRWEIAGRVDEDVDGVTLVREDGRVVVATLDGGWFLAWWPSESEPVSMELRTSAGATDTVTLGDAFAHEPSCKISFLDRICIWQ